MEQQSKENGLSGRIIDLLRIVIMVAVIPWSIWVTTMIYSLTYEQKTCAEWRKARPTFMSEADGKLLRVESKNEIRIEVGLKLDQIAKDLNDLKVEIAKHMAATLLKP